MIAKLTKYEFRSSIKIMAMIWGALIVVSILLALTNPISDVNPLSDDMSDASGLAEILTVTAGILYAMVACAIVVVTVFIIIQRFYSSLLGDEGYLINTLPVKMWQLITSKGIAAACLVIISFLVGVISVLIIAHPDFGWLFEQFRRVLDEIPDKPLFVLIVIEGIILCVLGIVKSIYQIYASISLGQLLNRHRLLGSVGAYIGISVALTIISSIFIFMSDKLGIDYVIASATDAFSQLTNFNLMMCFLIFIEVLQIAAFHIISERILSTKLNLL